MSTATSLKDAKQRATQKFRRKTNAKGLVRLEVLVTANDKPLIKRLASLLSSQSATAQQVRHEVDRVLSKTSPVTGFDIFGSDLADDVFDGVFDHVRENEWRTTEL